MAVTLDVFHHIFSLNCSAKELAGYFENDYSLVIAGCSDDTSSVTEWLGESVKEGVQKCNVSVVPLPECNCRTADAVLKHADAAIVHLGSRVPSEKRLRNYIDAFSPHTAVLFLVGDFEYAQYAERFAQQNASCTGEGVSVSKESSLQPPEGASQSCPDSDSHAEASCSAHGWMDAEEIGSVYMEISELELRPRFDPTLPSIYMLGGELPERRFYAALRLGLGRWAYCLGRDFTVWREILIQSMVSEEAKNAAIAAAASSVTTSIPVIGLMLGLFAVPAETMYITARQMRLALLIGALYGRPIDFFARMHELLPVVGSAWGWRMLAREAVGYAPAFGPAAKAAIAWGGTRTIGLLSRRFYSSSVPIGEEEKKKIEAESAEMSQQAAKEFVGAEKL